MFTTRSTSFYKTHLGTEADNSDLINFLFVPSQ